MPRQIIIDTDPGQDDGVAILLALASPELEVRAIIAVGGNVPLARTQANARKLLDLAERNDIPVFAGCAGPLLGPLTTAEHVHGESGLAGLSAAPPKTPLQPQHGVDFLIETLRAAEPAALTLCFLGPLTDLAVALAKAPEIVAGIGEIVLMGGGFFEGGNVTPTAEFNIFVDPEAANIVLRCGRPITMLPLDATHGVLSTAERIARVEAIGNRCAEAAAAMMRFSAPFSKRKYGWPGAALHDPNVIAYLIDPTLYAARAVNVAVETGSALARGMTIVDYWGVTGRPANVNYVRSADADRFYDLLSERLANLP